MKKEPESKSPAAVRSSPRKSIQNLKGDLRSIGRSVLWDLTPRILEELEKIDNEKERVKWAEVSKCLFELMAPKGLENENDRKSFREKLARLLGNQTDLFWLSAYKGYLMFLGIAAEKREIISKRIKESVSAYRYQKEEFQKHLRSLQKLHKKGFPPVAVLDSEMPKDPRIIRDFYVIRTKPLNLFIGFVGLELREIGKLKAFQRNKIIQDFVSYYFDSDRDIMSIKKTIQRFPSESLRARLRSITPLN